MMKFVPTLLIATSAVLTGCAGAQVEQADVNPTPHDMKEGAGLFSGKSGNLLDAFKNDPAGEGLVQTGGGAVPVNGFLWRASLEALSFMPLASADAAGGTIITDWYTNPNNIKERVKVNVMVLGIQFSVQNLKVSVFKQRLDSGRWIDMPADTETAAQLEETILTNARALKIKKHATTISE